MLLKKTSQIILLLLTLSLQMSAQVTESFTDGEILNNPAWNGDVGKFIVNTQMQLQSSSQIASDGFYVSTPSNANLNTEWNLWVKLGFNPSSANYVDVFLISDVQNLSAPANGYFVRLGNTTDEISLYRVSAGTATKIIDGADNTLSSSSNNTLSLKVTRTSSGVFTLLRDLTGTGSSFIAEGSITDNTFSAGTFFGIYVKQSTTSFFGKHFFDDVLVQPIPVDNTPPMLTKAEITGPAQVDVLFNEPLDVASAGNLSTYNITGFSPGISSASIDPQNAALVHLTLSANLLTGIPYTLEVTGIRDLAQNTNAQTQTSALYMAKLFDLLITEIMADPDPPQGLPNVEYIEIKNKTAYPVRLLEYTLEAGSGTYTLPDSVLPAGAYTILTSGSNASLFNPPVIGISGMSSTALTNTGTTLRLRNRLGDELHTITYSDSWYNDATKSQGGWSLESIDPGKPCAGAENWTACNNPMGGTPGQINSVFNNLPDNVSPVISSVGLITLNQVRINFSEPVFTGNLLSASFYTLQPSGQQAASVNAPGVISDYILVNFTTPLQESEIYTISIASTTTDCSGNNSVALQSQPFSAYRPQLFEIVFNEIMADPTPAVGLPDAEYIELYNRSNFPIDLSGWTLKIGSSIKNILSGSIPANGYALITRSPSSFSGSINYLQVEGLSSSFLTNSGTTLELRDTTNQLVCAITYSDKWYKDAGKIEGGWSLEQIDPANPCGGIANWRASVANTGGSPGLVNSVLAIQPDNTAPSVLDVCASGNQLLVQFSETILASGLQNLTSYSVSGVQGNPSSVQTDGSELTNTATLVFNAAFNSQDSYTLTISQPLNDCKGNSSTSSVSIPFSNRVPKPFELVINEIMADPDPIVGLPSAEYVEIFNRTDTPYSLNNFIFSYGTSSAAIGCRSIAAHSFVLLYNENNQGDLQAFGKGAGLSSFSITNAGTTLSLIAPAGQVISTVTFSDTWYGSTLKNQGGWSLEQVDPENPCAGASNWKASVNLNGGTPGTANSVGTSNPDKEKPKALRAYPVSSNSIRVSFNEPLFPSFQASWFSGNNGLGTALSATPLAPDYRQVLLTFSGTLVRGTTYEISIDAGISDCAGNNPADVQVVRTGFPEMVFGGEILITEILNDPASNGYDYVEILNNTQKILDVKNLRISNYDTTSFSLSGLNTIDTAGFLLLPGKYYVLTENPDWLQKNYHVPYPENVIEVENLPTFSIDNGTCAFSKWNDSIVDRMQYDIGMHIPWLSNTKGVSLERILLDSPATQYSNWTSASQSAGFGTPTDKNSQFLQNPGAKGSITLSSDFVSPDNDGYQDQVVIDFSLDKAGYQGSCKVVDTRGRTVFTFLQNQSLGSTGSFVWNGSNDADEKTSVGIYLVVMDLYHADGHSITLRKPLVVAGKL